MFVSRSYSALAIEVSISEGDCLDGLFGAILLRAADDIFMVMVSFVRRANLEVWKFALDFSWSVGGLCVIIT
jgi:hypothetical protein